ncbi:hypothetical protein NDU88_007043 [Pleurodeles waltl]|uniref:Uncharacterized protein n=1 Tax=Pleurodeles waltl TaxID=8319 RepID=A0AAV7LQX0_PLEWA|nr:hypothetical protein NDU88_007043 [Pleurodeles waltl]
MSATAGRSFYPQVTEVSFHSRNRSAVAIWTPGSAILLFLPVRGNKMAAALLRRRFKKGDVYSLFYELPSICGHLSGCSVTTDLNPHLEQEDISKVRRLRITIGGDFGLPSEERFRITIGGEISDYHRRRDSGLPSEERLRITIGGETPDYHRRRDSGLPSEERLRITIGGYPLCINFAGIPMDALVFYDYYDSMCLICQLKAPNTPKPEKQTPRNPINHRPAVHSTH